MASRAAASSVLFLILAAFTAGTSAATFNIRNNCPYTVNGPNLVCPADKCEAAYNYPTDDTKNHACNGNNNSYQVIFCP
ncbi:hypothetical protein PR202_ga11778 [Eleusine coracana subsp. coracana]|uniref:Uncharacterized protein n=1 Tax=Eleusine coracana subsp. coracana TaxID=191504 RepID=A0AAV5CAE1_ELECO|nr:hypothetical protein PR202_ga11778 [Eleusine coracana subsp. coracana]